MVGLVVGTGWIVDMLFFFFNFNFVWVLMTMVGWGFANDGVGGVVSNFGGWALIIWVFRGGS